MKTPLQNIDPRLHRNNDPRYPETMMSRVHGPILAIELWTLEWTLWNILSTTNDSEKTLWNILSTTNDSEKTLWTNYGI